VDSYGNGQWHGLFFLLPVVNYATTERAAYFAFNSAKAQDAYAYFL
jgi:hypothetical protein